jgi:hypothetical protein
MLIEASIVCLSHGLTSLLVHGCPSAKLAEESLLEKDIKINKFKFSLIWIGFYTILAPITFYRLFQSNDKWIPIYSFSIVQSFFDEEV